MAVYERLLDKLLCLSICGRRKWKWHWQIGLRSAFSWRSPRSLVGASHFLYSLYPWLMNFWFFCRFYNIYNWFMSREVLCMTQSSDGKNYHFPFQIRLSYPLAVVNRFQLGSCSNVVHTWRCTTSHLFDFVNSNSIFNCASISFCFSIAVSKSTCFQWS